MFLILWRIETVVIFPGGTSTVAAQRDKNAAKTNDTGMISGYSKGNKAPETTNVKIDFSWENLKRKRLSCRSSGIME